MGYRLTAKAESDIVAVAESGIKLFGEAQALRYHVQLFEMFELIATNPQMARERHEISPPVRIQPFKSHIILYLITDTGDVLILRVRHGHEDWPSDL